MRYKEGLLKRNSLWSMARLSRNEAIQASARRLYSKNELGSGLSLAPQYGNATVWSWN